MRSQDRFLALGVLFCVLTGLVACGTPPSAPGPQPNPVVHVRKDIYSYAPDSEFIKAFRHGVGEMMKRPVTDPTSWAYQANIHGFPDGIEPANCEPNSTGDPLTAWATCQHGTWFFLAWHRMYLYYFERIVRDASGDPGFALPFWDYEIETQRPLPVVFRDPADASNPLYVAERNTDAGMDMNAGDPVPAEDTNPTTALSRIPFDTPQEGLASSTFGGWQVPAPVHFASGYGGLERLPHNAIHNDVGGDDGWMADPNCAGRDPIFYLHHANIDRLWQVWINEGGGRMNPTDPTWLDTEFTFFDVGGVEVKLSGKQVLDTAMQLDYEYEGIPSGSGPSPAPSEPAPPTLAAEQQAEPEMMAASEEEEVVLGNEMHDVMIHMSDEAQRGLTAKLDAEAGPSPVILSLEGIRQEQRGVNYGVYLDLPEGTAPDPSGPYYVGHLALFTGHHGAMGQGDEAFNYYFDVTDVVRGLRASGEWSGDVRVTFVRTGPTPEGAPEEVHIRFKRATLRQ